MKIGKDNSWSESVIKGLEKIDSEYVFTIFDDLILNESVDSSGLSKYMGMAVANDFNYFRFRPYPPADEMLDEGYGRISKKADYRVSLCTSLVKKSVLYDLLQEGESAWDFELYGTNRSTKYNDFYVTNKSLLPYYNAIEKGQWNKAIIDELAPYDIDISKRGIFERKDQSSALGNFKHWLLFKFLPLRLRKLILKLLKNK